MALIFCRGLTRSRYKVEYTCIILQKFYSINQPEAKPKFETPKHDKPKTDTQFPAGKSITDEKPSPPLSSPTSENLPTTTPPSKVARRYDPQQMRENIRGYFFTRFIDYLKNYDKILEKKFPGAMKAYHVFMNGVKAFYQDAIALLKIQFMIKPEGDISNLTRKELELYYQMPRDIRKTAPLLLVSALPLLHYVILPVAFMYPRKMLTSHFWTLQQRNEFAILNIKERISCNRKVLRFLQSKLPVVINDKNYEKWQHILGLLGSGTHPTAQEVLDIKDLFAEPPYNTRSLSYTHVKNLCGLHGLMRGFCMKSRLTHRAICFHHMDLAIKREGGVHNMLTDALRNACFIRGLNAANLPNADLIEWLEKWVEISAGIDGSNFSLYLHLPVLITYNHPNNWHLLYKER